MAEAVAEALELGTGVASVAEAAALAVSVGAAVALVVTLEAVGDVSRTSGSLA